MSAIQIPSKNSAFEKFDKKTIKDVLIQLLENKANDDLVISVLESNNLKLINYLYDLNVFFKKELFVFAYKKGNINVIKWIIDTFENTDKIDYRQLLEISAENGNLNVLKYVYSKLNFTFNSNALYYATRNNHFEIVKWIMENTTEEYTYLALCIAVKNENMEMIEWFHESTHDEYNYHAIYFTIECGNLDIVKWFITKKYWIDMDYAIEQSREFNQILITDYLLKLKK